MNLNNAFLTRMSTHYVGNKNNELELILAQYPLELDLELATRLRDYFLDKIGKVYDRYQFTHISSLEFNEVYNYVCNMFDNEEAIHELSAKVAQHLYDKSDHPNIKSGELHVCHFSNCVIDEVSTDAIGIFKTEVKSGFFEIFREGETEFGIEYKQGIDLNRFDKGCLIFNTGRGDGFEVVIFDRQSKGDEAKYWKEDFLNLRQKDNDFHQTQQTLGIARQYITDQLVEEFEVDKADQIDMLNKSVEYFKTNHEFDQEEFASTVFQDENVARSFQSFDQGYREDRDLVINDGFSISTPAVKKQAKNFKSVLKLDKNFHIYIHGNRNLIEKGVDDSGRKYYKVYYDEEN